MASALSRSSQAACTLNGSGLDTRSAGMCDDGVSTFLNVRSRLFGIAYRMLGSVAEAEDVVQDVWLRWQTTDRTVVRDAAAFLATTATRLAINVSQSARARREIGVAPGQPEPLDTRNDPRSAAEREQALASGVWILLERLTPTERAAYILREAFDYAYRDIGSVLRVAESNARQVVSRARQHLVSGRTTVASPAEHRRLFDAFITAAHDGDIGALEHVLESGRGNSRSECADPGQ